MIKRFDRVGGAVILTVKLSGDGLANTPSNMVKADFALA